VLYAVGGAGGGGGIGGTLVDDCITKANGTSNIECSIIVEDSGELQIGSLAGFYVTQNFPAWGANRTWDWPDESGTFAMRKVRGEWQADSITQSGTCADPVTGQINGGPTTRWFLCADNASSVFEGKITRIPYAVTTVAFTLLLNHGTTETLTFAGAFSAQCRASGTTVNSTWGTAVAANVSITTAHQPASATTAAVTPNGTCSAGSTLFWRYVVDAGTMSTNAANTRILAVFMEQDS
jgi:hypothetical protein